MTDDRSRPEWVAPPADRYGTRDGYGHTRQQRQGYYDDQAAQPGYDQRGYDPRQGQTRRPEPPAPPRAGYGSQGTYGAPPPERPAVRSIPLTTRNIVIAVVLGFVLVGIGAAIGGSGSSQTPAAASTPLPTVASAAAAAAPAAVATVASAAPTTRPAVPRIVHIAMPNLVGQSYSYALDKLDPNVFHVETVDATGQGRLAIDPFHWRVARQSVRVGTPIASGASVTLFVLKIGEADAGVTS